MADVSSPVEVLRAAADRLDQLAESTSPSPWVADLHEVHDWGWDGIATKSDFGDLAEADADWIAMLGPQVAPALSTWLRTTSIYVEEAVESSMWTPSALVDWVAEHPAYGPALTFARMVLGLPAVSDTTGEGRRG